MKKFRVGLIVGAIIVIIGELSIIDYDNLTLSKNWGLYLLLLGMIYTISSLILSIRRDKKQQTNLTNNTRQAYDLFKNDSLNNNDKNIIDEHLGSRALAARAHPGSRASYFLMRARKIQIILIRIVCLFIIKLIL